MQLAICETCGTMYPIGAWPFCPHEVPDEYHPFKHYIDENLLDHDVEITSIAQRNRIMRETHAADRPKGRGMPGQWI